MPELLPIASGMWCAVGRGRAYGVELGQRMTVMQVGGDQLLVHAPIEFEPALGEALSELGEVRALCAPNLRCCDHLRAWVDAFPTAERWVAPGAIAQQRHIDGMSELDGELEPPWADELNALRFEGVPTLNEVAFLHRPSRSLVLADLAICVPERLPLLARGYLRLSLGGQRFGPTRDLRWLVVDRAAAARSVAQLLDWSFERIIVRHGDVLARDAKPALERAYRWLSGNPAWWQ